MKKEHIIPLDDGHEIGVSELGSADGRPLFYFHGFPGSRLEAGLAREAAVRNGVRLIAPDRPGIGLSSFQPHRSLADWASDVAHVADHLGIGRFAVLGVSGGAPYAFACAAQLAPRIIAAGIVSGLGPLAGRGAALLPSVLAVAVRICRLCPLLGDAVVHLLGRYIRQHPQRLLQMMTPHLVAADRAALKDAVLAPLLRASLAESMRRSPRGCARDLRIYCQPWGVALNSIRCPLYLWHGNEDRITPVAMAHALERSLPLCRVRYLDGEGHYSLPLNHIDEIIRTLAAGVSDCS